MKKKIIALAMACVMTTSALCAVLAEEAKLPAFPGAEGGGKYTTGGRGGEVYIVTNLEDYDPNNEEPIPGSFRDAVSQDNRIIVFNVSGVIELKDAFRIKAKNLTIAGQSAPGDGITLYGYETNISNAENLIMRYIRFRAGDKNVFDGDSMDAIWGRAMKNVIIDHISTSWSTDETMSLYRAENMTVQWSTIAESLTMSGHTKGRHGYGGIWGGVNTTYHHNLIANHTSRNPRMGGGTPEADDNDHVACFDMRNNVIYNWGFNTSYGGGRADANYVYNYMKAGPGTRDDVASRVIDLGEADKPGRFYVNGNVLEGNEEISSDNSKGIYIDEDNAPFVTVMNEEFQMEGTKPENLRTTTPEEAYNEVLAKAGATYPRRDALDARIIAEVRNGGGKYANRDEEVGGLPYTAATVREAGFDKDKDGISDAWELKNGLNPADSTDSIKLAANGYANIENYLNSLVDMNYAPGNPSISLTSPVNNQVISYGEEIKITADAADSEGIAKVEFYNGAFCIGEDYEAPYELTVKLPMGSYYISAKATDVTGLQTQASASAVHINAEGDLKEWESADIGTPNIKGSAFLSADGTMTVKGAGKLQNADDACHFVYQPVEGDFEFSVKLDSAKAVDNHAFSGIMVRESLDSNAKTAIVGLSSTKSYQWKEKNPETGKETTYNRNPWSVYLAARTETDGKMDKLLENLDSPEKAEESGVALLNDIPFKDFYTELGYYLKLTRKGDVFTAYASADGESYSEIGSKEIKMDSKLYLGLGADGNKVANKLDNLNIAKFSSITLK